VICHQTICVVTVKDVVNMVFVTVTCNNRSVIVFAMRAGVVPVAQSRKKPRATEYLQTATKFAVVMASVESEITVFVMKAGLGTIVASTGLVAGSPPTVHALAGVMVNV